MEQVTARTRFYPMSLSPCMAVFGTERSSLRSYPICVLVMLSFLFEISVSSTTSFAGTYMRQRYMAMLVRMT